MTRKEASEKLEKYNYLVGKTIAQGTIAAIMPLPLDTKMTVEQMFQIVFNNVPHQLFSDYTDFRIVVVLNYQEFLANGVVVWKDLDDVLGSSEIEQDNE